MKNYLNYLLGCLLVLGGCKGCEKEDPCPEVSAEFTYMEYETHISTYNDEYWTKYFADTICSDRILLEAKDLTCDKYEWTIGNGKYYGKKVEISGFYKAIENGQRSVNIKLLVKKLNRNNCFNREDTILREINKTIHMVSFDKSPLFGNHFGYFNDSPNDTFTVKYYTNKWFSTNDNEWIYSARINVFSKKCLDSSFTNIFTFRQMQIYDSNLCDWQNIDEIIGNISVLDGTFRIRGKRRKGTTWTNFTFTGTKRQK